MLRVPRNGGNTDGERGVGNERGIKNHVKRIVFVHGVGQGVFKQEVAGLLNRKFKKYYFQDASFKEYGYGATMVILRNG